MSISDQIGVLNRFCTKSPQKLPSVLTEVRFVLGSIPMVVGLPQLETKLNAIICGGLVFHNWRHFFSFYHKSWQVLLFVSSMNAYKLAFYEEKRFIPKSPTIPIPKIPFCNPIEREPRELKRGEKK